MGTVKRTILLNPGPATTTDTVKNAQVVPDICPREEEFGKLMEDISLSLTRLVADAERYATVLFGGSGTAAVESILSSVVRDDAVVIINNGAYGKRMCEIAAAYGLNCLEFKSSPEEAVDLPALEAAIRNSPQTVSHVAVVHNETTTGLLTDIEAIGKLCGKYRLDLIVDAMSSFGAIPIQMEQMNIRYLAASSNKNLQGMPGIAFVVAEKSKLDSLKSAKPRNYYLNLHAQYEHFAKTRQMRFTPPVQTLYALKQALEELKEEGLAARYARYSKSWETLVHGMSMRGLKHLVAAKNHSKIVTSFVEPDCEGFDFQAMHDFFYVRGFTIYPGKIDNFRTFRIANIGDISFKDIEAFLTLMDEYLLGIGNSMRKAAGLIMPLPDSKNKFLKYRFMNNSANLKPYMPETRWMTALTFQQMLAKYKKVIVKPVGGSRGQGVFQVSALEKNLYEVHVENRKYKVRGQQQAFALVQRHVGARGYMVQRCISRASINGRPFDMRVIVQRKTNSPIWVVTGKIAKVAGSGYIVSNIERSNGTVLPVGTAIARSSLKGRSPYLLQKNLNRVALLSVKRLTALFPEHRMYGFDLALDRQGRVWIIEANLFPARSHFRKLADKTMLRRITAYKFG